MNLINKPSYSDMFVYNVSGVYLPYPKVLLCDKKWGFQPHGNMVFEEPMDHDHL